MSFTMRDVADGVIDVAIQGRLDTPGVEAIETRLSAEVIAHHASTTIDLSRVEFVGSMGIRMFVSLARSLARQNRKLVLYSPQPQVKESFDSVGLDTLIPIASDGPTALAAARA